MSVNRYVGRSAVTPTDNPSAVHNKDCE